MSEFTPGPWQASGNGIHTEKGRCVALTYMEPKTQRDVDARLISAAPDLLTALNLALEYVEHDVEEWAMGDNPLESNRSKAARKLRDVLNAAKAKAEGK